MSRATIRALAVISTLLALGGQAAGPALAQDGYQIRAGDVLQIEVIEDPSLNRETLVSPDGRITVPLAGAIRASGRTVEEVQAELTERLAPNFAATPNVFVGISRIVEEPPPLPPGPEEPPPTIDIYVVGEAASPGRLELEPGTTLLQAIAQMGGFSPYAATRRLQLRRTDPVSGQEFVYSIDYVAIEEGRSTAGTVTLVDGDVIVVPQRGLFE